MLGRTNKATLFFSYFSSLSVLFDFQFAHKSLVCFLYIEAGEQCLASWRFLLIGAHMRSSKFSNVLFKL